MAPATSATSLAAPTRAPAFYELHVGHVAPDGPVRPTPGRRTIQEQHSWYGRMQNCVVGVTWLGEGQDVEKVNVPDEHLLLIPEGSAVRVASGSAEPVAVDGAALVVVPAGGARVIGEKAGLVVQIFTSHVVDAAVRADNNAAYDHPDPSIARLPPLAPSRAQTGVRVYPLAEVPNDPDRFGRIFRTESLMVNWFEPQVGPRDTNKMTPHSHDDFEQASLTLEGDYVHHVRRPWTARLSNWRADEHVHVHSPSMTIIPPGDIHTTRAVGDGVHQLIDVFAPPRQDFIQRGWVLNQNEYEQKGTTDA